MEIGDLLVDGGVQTCGFGGLARAAEPEECDVTSGYEVWDLELEGGLGPVVGKAVEGNA